MNNRMCSIVYAAVLLTLAGWPRMAPAADDPIIGDKPLSQVIKQLRSDNRGLQLRAAQSLAKAPAEYQAQIVPQVIPVLQSDERAGRPGDYGWFKAKAFEALGRFGDKSAAGETRDEATRAFQAVSGPKT